MTSPAPELPPTPEPAQTGDLHCPHCGAKGTLTPDTSVTRAWVNWQDEDSGDNWNEGPDIQNLECSACHVGVWLSVPDV